MKAAAASARPLRVAVLSFAHTHARSYLSYLVGRDDIEVVSSDPDGASALDGVPRGADFAALYGVPYFDSYEEALAWGPDAVIVCAENARHRAVVELAAAAGAHILCEKPLATTVEDAEAMVAATDAAGVILMTAYPVRFSPAFASLRALAASGRLGKILAITGSNNGRMPLSERAWFTDPRLSGGGALVDHVVHCADLLYALLPEPLESVRAVTNRILYADAGRDVETGGIVSLRYESGVIATIDCSWSHAATAPNWGGLTLSITGTRGMVTIDPFAEHVGGHDASGEVWLAYGPNLDGAMIAEFLDAVRSARTPQPDGRAGLHSVRVMVAAQRSDAAGAPVLLATGSR